MSHVIILTGCTNGDVQLVGGFTDNVGIARVCVNGTYLPLSMLNLTVVEATVLCRELGAGQGNILLACALMTHKDPVWVQLTSFPLVLAIDIYCMWPLFTVGGSNYYYLITTLILLLIMSCWDVLCKYHYNNNVLSC